MRYDRYPHLFSTLLSLLLVMFSSANGRGQSFGPRDSGNLYHWGYAQAFGTGAYRVGDLETFVISADPDIRLRSEEAHPVGFYLTMPLSIGLQTVNPDEFLSQNIPDNFTIVSFTPGLELRIPLGSHWMLKPFANLGWGTEISGDQSAWIYGSGIKARYLFGWRALNFGLLSGLECFGYTPNPGEAEWFGRLLLGLESDYPLGRATFRGQQLFLRPHILYYYYFNDLDFAELPLQSVSVNQEVELALALGTKQLNKMWLIGFDRIGIGFRFSENSQGIRLFIRSVFD